MTIEFFIARNGNLIANGELIGNFANETAAADIAIRHAQDRGATYRIFYPL